MPTLSAPPPAPPNCSQPLQPAAANTLADAAPSRRASWPRRSACSSTQGQRSPAPPPCSGWLAAVAGGTQGSGGAHEGGSSSRRSSSGPRCTGAPRPRAASSKCRTPSRACYRFRQEDAPEVRWGNYHVPFLPRYGACLQRPFLPPFPKDSERPRKGANTDAIVDNGGSRGTFSAGAGGEVP